MSSETSATEVVCIEVGLWNWIDQSGWPDAAIGDEANIRTILDLGDWTSYTPTRGMLSQSSQIIVSACRD